MSIAKGATERPAGIPDGSGGGEGWPGCHEMLQAFPHQGTAMGGCRELPSSLDERNPQSPLHCPWWRQNTIEAAVRAAEGKTVREQRQRESVLPAKCLKGFSGKDVLIWELQFSLYLLVLGFVCLCFVVLEDDGLFSVRVIAVILQAQRIIQVGRTWGEPESTGAERKVRAGLHAGGPGKPAEMGAAQPPGAPEPWWPQEKSCA